MEKIRKGYGCTIDNRKNLGVPLMIFLFFKIVWNIENKI